MLQRIQSIYLLLAGLSILALFAFPLVHDVVVNGRPITVAITGVHEMVNGAQVITQQFIGLIIATVIAALFPIAIIFLYKNRKQQISLCYIAMLVIIAYSFLVS